MRFIIMHRTNPHWEAGAVPGPELIARVRALLERMASNGVLEGGEGLRPSSEGVRLSFTEGAVETVAGPLDGTNDLPAGFTILRARGLDDVIEWAVRHQAALDVPEVDIRPVTEPWDIGIAEAPAGAYERRYMVVRKATAATEAGQVPTASQQSALAEAIEEAVQRGVHVVTEHMRPSRRGRRYKNSTDGMAVSDGPFTETKELIGGYVIVSCSSLDEADPWAREYLRVVDSDEVEVRELD